MAGILDWLKGQDEDFDEEEEEQTVQPKSSKYEQPLSQDTSEVVKQLGKKESNLEIFDPRGFKDCYQIGKCLIQNRGAVVHLKRLTKEQQIRVYDFLCGVVYGIDGELQKLSDDIFIFTPPSIGLQGGISFEGEESN